MRKFIVIIILLLFIPLASASSNVQFYPNKEAFAEFLSSNSTYVVIPGESLASKSWSWYIEGKLSKIKAQGNETVILVGNVYDNPQMREVWELTNLPPEESLNPNIIVIYNAILVTGSEENLFKVQEAFSEIREFTSKEIYGLLIISALLVLFFFYTLSKYDTYVKWLYLLSMLLLILWILNTNEFGMSQGFIKSAFQKALEIKFGQGNAPFISYLMYLWFRIFSPSEEAVFSLQITMVLLIISLTFFLAPKSSRELGFLIFGLAFSSPIFREYVKTMDFALFFILTSTLTFALMMNFSFKLGNRDAKLENVLLSISVLLAISSNIYAITIPIAFILSHSKRYKPNYMHLGLTILGVLLVLLFFDVPAPKKFLGGYTFWAMFLNLIKDGFVQIALIAYIAIKNIERMGKIVKAESFLTLVGIAYFFILTLDKTIFASLILVLSALSIRFIQYCIVTKT